MPGVILGQAFALNDGETSTEAKEEEVKAPAGESLIAEESVPEDAVGFLRRLEEKNAGVERLHARFRQTRTSSVYLEEIESRGEFWYSRPNLFRCDYFEPSELRYYLIKDTAWIYTPELNQVDKIAMESGDGAAINQLLVGFGLDVDVILDVFEVVLSETQPESTTQIALDFTSKDIDRSLGYSRIQVTFDRENMEPKVLEMDQEEDTIVVQLDSVERDVEIDPVKFQAEFPSNVEIHEF
jgi:outer membrane lipoprotein-sorting protein